MLKNTLLILTVGVSFVLSRTINFRVISFGEKVQVQIVNGKAYNLKRDNSGDPNEILFTKKVKNLPQDVFQYYYIVDGKRENFERSTGPRTTRTYIEFYGRNDSYKSLKQFSYPDNHWNRSIGKTELFDDSYIPTVHISGNTAESLFANPKVQYYHLERVTFYLKNEAKVAKNVRADPKNRNFAKFQIKMKLNESESLYGRYLLKLRNGGEDPTNLRQFIYGNMIQAVGIPSIHSIMVRLYYNKKPMGLYTLQEEAYSDSFIKSEFYGNSTSLSINAPTPLGLTLDGTTGADFEYYPNNLDYYEPFDLKIGTEEDKKNKLVAFCGAISKLNTKNARQVKQFEKEWFDINTFHKAMAIEYLTADWDGYWYSTSNFAIYEDPTQATKNTRKFYYITQDHDETFGVGLESPYNTDGKNHPKNSYKTLIRDTWHLSEDDALHRTLVDKFIASSPDLQKRFEKTLISVVQNIFNPVTFREVVSSYYTRYQPEMEWDFSFKRTYVPSKKMAKNTPVYTYSDFVTNMQKGVDGLDWGLYEWVSLRAEAVKKEFCFTWKGDKNPPKCTRNYHDYYKKKREK
ncbi:hypothetical protein PIROE2DRAFT_14663 [Piromyces sp. E2]|nr:hypothetical protein PIROE2DRAFT_14663 [Piromyces sp. E2]|eukprot:OUM59726.1 hypothetical protein PIROE2DRAFT_14663 [Piromyces sp. E2]